MTIKEKILELGEETSDPSVTISFNTNRTHPETEQDRLVLKNLLSDAQSRVVEQYGEREPAELLKRIANVSSEIDFEFSLDSMHIFLSANTQEILKTTGPVQQNLAFVSNKFALRSLIDIDGRTMEYLVLLLSQGGVKLYEAMNGRISGEIKNESFPFPESPYATVSTEQASDAEKKDNLVREYFNQVDKALLNISRDSGRKCVVVCTEDNYSRLIQVADAPEMYLGDVPIDYNNCEPHQIVKQTWEIIQKVQIEEKEALLEEIRLAVSAGKVVTDLHEIFQSAIDGRADLLVVNQEFSQPVKITSDRTFELSDDAMASGTNEDIINMISWEVVKNGGRVAFTTPGQLKDYGNIALKVRY